MKRIRKQEKRGQKRGVSPVCPYCGRTAVLKPAEYVHGERTFKKGTHLYVCSAYPECQAYVSVNERNLEPIGTLADRKLRKKRIEAHRLINQIVRYGYMSQKDVYRWLANRLELPYRETHIGYFSDYLCEQVIKECGSILENYRCAKAA